MTDPAMTLGDYFYEWFALLCPGCSQLSAAPELLALAGRCLQDHLEGGR